MWHTKIKQSLAGAFSRAAFADTTTRADGGSFHASSMFRTMI
jgi:hypothetical protein